MIKPGNIVYLRYRGGLEKNKLCTKTIGLVIKELKEKGAIPQFYVQFGEKTPKWFYNHDLYQIRGERNENAKL